MGGGRGRRNERAPPRGYCFETRRHEKSARRDSADRRNESPSARNARDVRPAARREGRGAMHGSVLAAVVTARGGMQRFLQRLLRLVAAPLLAARHAEQHRLRHRSIDRSRVVAAAARRTRGGCSCSRWRACCVMVWSARDAPRPLLFAVRPSSSRRRARRRRTTTTTMRVGKEREAMIEGGRGGWGVALGSVVPRSDHGGRRVRERERERRAPSSVSRCGGDGVVATVWWRALSRVGYILLVLLLVLSQARQVCCCAATRRSAFSHTASSRAV